MPFENPNRSNDDIVGDPNRRIHLQQMLSVYASEMRRLELVRGIGREKLRLSPAFEPPEGADARRSIDLWEIGLSEAQAIAALTNLAARAIESHLAAIEVYVRTAHGWRAHDFEAFRAQIMGPDHGQSAGGGDG